MRHQQKQNVGLFIQDIIPLIKVRQEKMPLKSWESFLSKCVNKIKPYKVAICKLPKVKNGSFGRETNNNEINKFNQALDDIADGLRGGFQNTDIKVLDYNLEKADIRNDGIHPNQNGIQKMVFSLRNYTPSVGYQPSVSNVSMKRIKKQPIDNVVNNWNRSGHMGYNAFG